LADTKPGTDTHKRISSSLAEAKKELANLGVQPVTQPAPVIEPAAAPAERKKPAVATKADQILRGDLSVPTPEAMQAEEQRRQQAQAQTRKEQAERGFVEKYLAPLIEVPTAVLTAPIGMAVQQATGGKRTFFEPQSGQSKEILGEIGGAFEAAKLEGLMGYPILQRGAKAPGMAPKPEPRPRVEPTFAAAAEGAPAAAPAAARAAAPAAGRVSVGAAASADPTTIRQALEVASPALKAEISATPANKLNFAALQRQIEADSLGISLTEGQATADPVKLSNEFNRRGKDTDIAYRLGDQNQKLIQAIDDTKDIASPDVYGARTMDHGQAVIDAYKKLDTDLTTAIDAKYQALRDAAGGQFPVDAPALLKNVQASLKKQLLSNDAPPSQFKELTRLAEENNMTFEDFLSLRRNLGNVARTAQDGNVRTAAGIMVKELENLPLQEGAKQLKPLADAARKSARDRFQMLEKDPAYRAAIDDKVPAEKFINTFVIDGVNKNMKTMMTHLDDTSRQHLAAGTINYLRERAIDTKGNFTQAGYNKALMHLDRNDKLPIIFNGDSASRLKTIGAVGRYTQAQPAGSYLNHSGTFIAAMAERAKAAVGKAAETSLNLAVPGAQVGSAIMEARARRAQAKETQRALKPGAGIRNE
jgi:hypothetical protein